MDADRAVNDQARRNLRAFIWMTDVCELGETTASGPDRYWVLFGHTPKRPLLFVLGPNGDHPRLRTYETHDEFVRNGKIDYTTAAGAHQITASTWDSFIAARGAWCAFDEAGQDECASWLIDRAGALGEVFIGRITHAIALCSGIWASLPGNTSGQPQRPIDFCLIHYQDAGGVIA